MIVELKTADRGKSVSEYVNELKTETVEYDMNGHMREAVICETDSIDEVIDDLEYSIFVVDQVTEEGTTLDYHEADAKVTVYDWYME